MSGMSGMCVSKFLWLFRHFFCTQLLMLLSSFWLCEGLHPAQYPYDGYERKLPHEQIYPKCAPGFKHLFCSQWLLQSNRFGF